MKVQRTNLLAGAVLLALGSAHAGEMRNPHAPNAIPGRYIVVFKDGSSQVGAASAATVASAQSIAGAMGKRFGARIARTYSKALRGALMEMSPAQAEKLARDPEVDFVEPDMVFHTAATQSGVTWGLDRIDQIGLPLTGSYSYASNGAGVHAYVIDSGVRTNHNEFYGRIGNGADFIGDGYGASDCAGHGTHVAGTLGGTTWGVAKGVIIHSVRVLGCDGNGSTSAIVGGMDWVAQNHIKPAVANMSLTGGMSYAMDAAATRLVNAGVTTVIAAGNQADDACNYSPARANGGITVGSTTRYDSLSNFSNYGSCVNIFAPGSDVVSASMNGTSAYTTMSGTSMASPHVAGVAALYLANNRSATPAQVANALYSTAQNNRIGGIPYGVNKLLYAGNLGSGGGGGGTKGFSVNLPNVAAGQSVSYSLDVPSGARNLRIAIAGGVGDADLYVRFGAAPTTSVYDCRPYTETSNEYCTAATPTVGRHYIMVRAYNNLSGVKLSATYE